MSIVHIISQKRTSCNKPAADLYSNAVPTTCQQDVFALLVPILLQGCWAQQACIQVVPKQLVVILHVIQQFVNKLLLTTL
jgi:hypothetical protein